MNKKGAELSLNVIVIAVIVLIVLIVLVIILTGRTGQFTKSTQEASAPYGTKACDVPGTGRYCASSCFEGDSNTGMKDFTCNDQTKGIAVCCCCKFL